MRDRGLREFPFRGRVRVAVEREDAAGAERAARQPVIDVLTSRIPIDLDRHGCARRRLEDTLPVRPHTRTHTVLAPSRVPEDVHAWRTHGGQDSPRLIP